MIDTSELDRLAFDLGRLRVPTLIRPVMSKAGLAMKQRAQAQAPKGAHLGGYARTIQYEIKDAGLTVEVGPKEEGQGLLSAVLEYGQGRNAAVPHITPQLDLEAAVTEEWLGKVIEEALGG